jgi:hypothetical protein
MIDSVMGHKDFHILIPETCEYVTLHKKRHHADGVNLRILRQGNFPVLPEKWDQCNHKGFYKIGKRARVRERGNEEGQRERERGAGKETER